MAQGRFVIVPDELTQTEHLVDLLPAPLHLRRHIHTVKHSIINGLSIVFQAYDNDNSPHEMEHLLSDSLSTVGISLHAEIMDDRLNVVVSDNDTLRFANSIPLKNNSDDIKTDVLYHLLAVIQHLDLDTAKVPVSFRNTIDTGLRYVLSKYLCLK